MATEVHASDQVRDYYQTLLRRERAAFEQAVDALAEHGVNLRRPLVAEMVMDGRVVRGKRYPAAVRSAFGNRLKELRPTPTTRVLFVFAPNRAAVLLYAWDKGGDFADSYYPAVAAAYAIWTALEGDFR